MVSPMMFVRLESATCSSCTSCMSTSCPASVRRTRGPTQPVTLPSVLHRYCSACRGVQGLGCICTWTSLPRRRRWPGLIFSLMCCLPGLRRITLPVPVTLYRLAAACGALMPAGDQPRLCSVNGTSALRAVPPAKVPPWVQAQARRCGQGKVSPTAVRLH